MPYGFTLFIMCLSYSILGFSQDTYEYFGALKLNDSALISYKIIVTENNGLVNGYSLTDLGGAHETKSYLTGYFDDEKDELEFVEKGIVYTKSSVTKYDFCFVHFKGKLKRLDERQEIHGNFKGLYDDGNQCIDGEMRLASMFKFNKKTERLDRRIDRNPLVKKEDKARINLKQALDSLQMKFVNKDERITIFSTSDVIQVSVIDAGQEDGDRISLWANGEIVLDNYEVTNSAREVTIPLHREQTVVKIQAENNGRIGGNTVQLKINDTSGLLETNTNFKSGESAEFVFVKRNGS